MTERVYTDGELLAMLGMTLERTPLWRRALNRRETRQAHRCSICGGTDHNRRSCGDVTLRVRATQRCSACGELGHNRRSCRAGQTTTGDTP